MTQNEISELPRLSEQKYENIFNIYINEDNRYFYNLLQTVNFPDNLPEGIFTTYTTKPGDTLPFISYKVYRTINLWWVICLINKIDNPTIFFEPGTILKILNNNTLRILIQEINA